jgi:hypothetical protein
MYEETLASSQQAGVDIILWRDLPEIRIFVSQPFDVDVGAKHLMHLQQLETKIRLCPAQ